jgi:phytoene dehydrogenase-like protein
VTVVEKNERLGGCTSTEEVWPGYKVSVASYALSLMPPSIIQDLKLKEYGLRVLKRDPSSFTPDLDGPGLVLGFDKNKNAESIAHYNAKDASNYSVYQKKLENIAIAADRIAKSTPPNIWKPWKTVRPFFEMCRTFSSVPKKDLNYLMNFVSVSAEKILEEWFESEILKTTLATDGIIGYPGPPSHPGTAYVLLHHVMGETDGVKGIWAYVQGGMGGLADALEKACLDLGVHFSTGVGVKKILVEKGKAVGVLLADNSTYSADFVASSVDCNITFKKLLSPELVPEDFMEVIDRIDYTSASAKLNIALNKLPSFIGGSESRYRGTIHISPSIYYINEAFADFEGGVRSNRPVLELTIPSVVDPTVAPEGKHLMNVFFQYVPYQDFSLDWKKDIFDSCLRVLKQYAPDFEECVDNYQLLTPYDLEQKFGLTGGNIFQGAMSLSNLYINRPVPGWANYKMPVDGLYLCGAAAHPGGGVHGLCGRNAAYEIMKRC